MTRDEARRSAMAGSLSEQARVAAIYARVSSERQREQATIESQLAALRELASERGLIVAEELVFADEGFSGASLARPALERPRDRAAEGCFELLLCHAPDRLARRYAYQVLLLEELDRAGVEVCFAKEAERSGSPEDELLRQFQGMIAEYERAQIAERTRRGKLHRARQGSQAVLSGAPYGYRYVRKGELTDAYYAIDEPEAAVVREIFRRYAEEGESIAVIARVLSAQGIPTRTGKQVWDRSTIWGILRNPAYRGEAAFGKTATGERPGKPTRTTRRRGERHGRRPARRDRPAAEWTLVPVPALVPVERFELAQARLGDNKRFARRNTKQPTLLQGLLVCRECGYACYRTSTRTTKRRIYYYRCIGSDNYRHVGGRVCQSRPIRQDELDALVWDEVRRLLAEPALVRAEIERRLDALRQADPASKRRDALGRELQRVRAGSARLLDAYQESLLTLDQLRARMPKLRERETTLQTQLEALEAELHTAETYLKLAETLEGFLARLAEAADDLSIEERQRVLRLVVREVHVGGDDTVTIRHSIPAPQDDQPPGYLLRGSSQLAPARQRLPQRARPSLRGALREARAARPLRRRSGHLLLEAVAGEASARSAERAPARARASALAREDHDRQPGSGGRGLRLPRLPLPPPELAHRTPVLRLLAEPAGDGGRRAASARADPADTGRPAPDHGRAGLEPLPARLGRVLPLGQLDAAAERPRPLRHRPARALISRKYGRRGRGRGLAVLLESQDQLGLVRLVGIVRYASAHADGERCR
jgi:site-specific DNA recombinase